MIERVRGAYTGRNRSSAYRDLVWTVATAEDVSGALMDRIWCDWMGPDPRNWPQRACLGVDLEGGTLIEVTATAVRKSSGTNE